MEENRKVKIPVERYQFKDEREANSKVKNKAMIVAICIVCFIIGYFFNGMIHVNQSDQGRFAKLNQVYDMLMNDFYFTENDDKAQQHLIDGAIAGMVGAEGDPHTNYFTPDEATSFTSSMEGSIIGIGVQIYTYDEYAYIVSDVFPDSPADKAGVKSGDIFVSVDGASCDDLNGDELLDKVLGKENTDVTIEFKRGQDIIKKVITRKQVNSSVFASMVDKVGYVKLTSFSETSGDDFGYYLKQIHTKGCKQLIIDLRDNGGGYLTSAIQIASYLLGDNKVVIQEEKRNKQVEKYQTIDGYPCYEFDEIYVLINGNTASASEALCAALKDYLDATVVGTTSYGKGTVQNPQSFSDGTMVKYTIGEWLSPKGNHINNKGITPDIVIQQDQALECQLPVLEKDEVYKQDSVSWAARNCALFLKYLGYDVDRVDQYYSKQNEKALKQYQSDNKLKVDGIINKEMSLSLYSDVLRKWKSDEWENDIQLKKVLELCKK